MTDELESRRKLREQITKESVLTDRIAEHIEEYQEVVELLAKQRTLLSAPVYVSIFGDEECTEFISLSETYISSTVMDAEGRLVLTFAPGCDIEKVTVVPKRAFESEEGEGLMGEIENNRFAYISRFVYVPDSEE